MRQVLASRARSVLYLEDLPEGRVVLKVLTAESPSPREVLALDNDLEVTRGLALDGVRRAIRRDRVEGRHALVLAYVEGEPLGAWSGRMAAEPGRFLRVALALARTLAKLHARGVIHKDIKPANVLYDPATGQVTLIDFGISARVDGRVADSSLELEGTLAYMPPEQTGRLQRPVDARSDLYSTGATFYELLTGRPPFVGADASELVHAHLARPPVPPDEIDRRVAPQLSAITLRLLAKDPDDRYQTAAGLARDLERALADLDATGHIALFPPGVRDISERLRLPGRLYGREAETVALEAALTRACEQGRELLLVAGYSGVGKSSLIAEAGPRAAARGGVFVAGKFDLLGQAEPYHALLRALRDLASGLLGEGEEELAAVRGRLLGELVGQGGVLIELLPELGAVLGEQPPVPVVGASEARHRLAFVMRGFLRAVARSGRPVVLFLDDLQWADQASLELLGELARDPSPGLLLLGAYRDNEVGPAHPLVALLDGLRAARATVSVLTLGELAPRAVEQLLGDTLYEPAEQVASLAALVHEKTRGNAFFVRQFLGQLHDDGELRFAADERRWRWDDAAVRARHVTDNVADFVGRRLVALGPESQRALAAAACLGAEVAPGRVARVLDADPAAVVRALWPAVEGGLLVAVGEAYRLALAAGVDQLPDATLRFVHDRVQQDALALIPDADRAALHLRAGRLWRQGEFGGDEDRNLFWIVNHYNQVTSLLTDEDERLAVARLNLEAARKAKRSAAHDHAYEHLRAGLALLPTDAFARHHDLALGLHSEAAEGAFLVADEEGVQRHSEPVLRLARRPIDKIQAATARLLQAQAGGALDRALDIGWQALRELGVAMPRHPGVPHIGLGLVSVKWALLGRDTAALLALPPLESPELEAALVLMERMVPPAFRSGSQLFPLLVLRPLQIALRSGNATVSSFAYASYGIMLSGVLGDLEGGHRFGRLALDLAARRHHDGYRSKALFVFGNFLQHWREPLLRSTETLFEAYRTGLASGNVFEALWAAVYRACWMFTAGVELGEVEAQLAAIGDLVRHDDTARTTAALLRQAVANLRGGPEGMTELSGLHYDETEAQARFARASDKIETFAFHLLKLRLWLLAGDPSRALGHAIEAEKYLEAVTAMPFVREIRFHGSVARLQASAPDALRHARRTLKLLRTWAQHEDSWAYRVDLLQALVARRRGDPAAARQACERALAGARRAGVLHDEVLASEIGAELHAGHPVLEGAMRENIVRALRQWGAQAQLSRLGVSTTNPRPDSDPTFPTSLRLGQVLPATPSGPQSLLSGSLSGSLGGSLGGPPSGTGSVSSSSTSRQGVLDLASALKAAATISAELQMERLLERLLRIILENAGAERGSLLLLDGAEPRVHAEGLADGTVQVHEGVAMAQAPWVCEPVVRFVARTSEPLVLADAQQDARFASVPYVRRHGIRSVLCAPVLHQGRLLALVYLENNLAPASFTPARLQVLTLLSGQAAVALENARLVANLDATVALRTRELNDRNQELRASLDHLADELSEAAAYVQSLLPAPTTGSPRISWRFVPSAHLGGDAFGYHWLAPGLLAFYLLDVAGHGIASALHSVTVLSALQSQRLPGVDFRRPGAVMAALNQTFPREQSGGFYFTAFYATLDVASGAIRFANGGHPPPTIIGPDGLRELDPTGPMVGVLPDMPYDEGDATLHPGERLFLFSDGVYELERPGGAMVTYEEFLEALRAEGRGDDKLAAMEQFARTCRGNRSLDDDFSMVLLEA